jgi:hypothetical protein
VLSRRRGRELAEHTAARRRREDEAPRLTAEVPTLATLSLTIEERRAGGIIISPHIRRVVVETAPAIFIVPCGASGCAQGMHDLTYAVVRELRSGATQFSGETSCDGCDCVMRHAGNATYR